MRDRWSDNQSTDTVDGLARRRLLLSAREQAARELDRLTNHALEKLDDVLFEHAEKAASVALQSHFISAVRELRQLRRPLASAFSKQMQKEFDQFFATELLGTHKPAAHSYHNEDTDALTLMNNVELEEDLAVLAIIAKGEKFYHNALGQLTGLWASLMGRHRLAVADIPVGPDTLANQFRRALAIWPGYQAIKPVVYDVFYEHVVARLGGLYQKLIDDMQQAGIKPVTAYSRARKTPHVGSSRPTEKEHAFSSASRDPVQTKQGVGGYSEPASAIPDEAETSIFGLVTLVRHLLDSQRESLGLPTLDTPSEEWLAPMRPDALVTLLSQLQQQFAAGSSFDLKAAQDSSTSFRRVLSNKLEKMAKQQHQQVHALDQNIIDVVMMLFDFMLGDPTMPDPMKALIAKLQIPVLQMAINDRSFLSNRSHPARSLLNNLSRAAIRWVDDGDYNASSMYGMIEQVVNRVLDSNEQNAALYADVDSDFTDYLQREKRAAKIAEERLSQVSRGQEQLSAARRRVADELDRMMREQMPVSVYKILDEAWRDVLTLTLLREGDSNPAWDKIVSIAERLIDSVIPRDHEWERQKIMRDIPLLLADLREGFFSISYDKAKSAYLLKQLQLCHITVLRGISPPMQPVPKNPNREQLFADTEYMDEQNIQLAQSIEIGQWIRWMREDGTETRGKLSWRSEIADLLLFVDNRGRKTIEMSNEYLNNLFSEDKASVIQEINEPIMDRALREMYGMLRQTTSEKSHFSI